VRLLRLHLAIRMLRAATRLTDRAQSIIEDAYTRRRVWN